jgi:hypothetical protein
MRAPERFFHHTPMLAMAAAVSLAACRVEADHRGQFHHAHSNRTDRHNFKRVARSGVCASRTATGAVLFAAFAAISAVASGVYTLISLTSVLPHVPTGRLKVLGVGYTRCLKRAPEIPTIAETVPGFRVPNLLFLLNFYERECGPPLANRRVATIAENRLAGGACAGRSSGGSVAVLAATLDCIA